jgi:thiamine pyrophosphate-dependent acetolactate synthase large subunit-like protein
VNFSEGDPVEQIFQLRKKNKGIQQSHRPGEEKLIPARRGQMHTLSGNQATMAPGLPYTIAAQIAFPNRQCVAFVGDGGFSILMADFVTAVKYKLSSRSSSLRTTH